jgi:molecular chaperone DnaK
MTSMKMELFTTAEDNQTSVEIHVIQGERDLAEYNKSLGRFKLSGLDPQPRGVAQVDVTFDLNTDGILAVTASDRRTGVERRVSLCDRGVLGLAVGHRRGLDGGALSGLP